MRVSEVIARGEPIGVTLGVVCGVLPGVSCSCSPVGSFSLKFGSRSSSSLSSSSNM